MCGIAGFINASGLEREEALATGVRMAEAIHSRGPDGSGAWADEESRIVLTHRRLSILDLSETGRQPMVSPSGRHVIIFNGEIYNHLDLRSQLASEGCDRGWRGHSDTETLLAAIDAWGLPRTLERAYGMFAIALWDKQTQMLSLARDRFGEKPLYYGWQGHQGKKALLFGSELKALKPHPSFEGKLDRDAIALLLRYNCVPAPWSIYKSVRKVLPGHILTFAEGQTEPDVQIYWNSVEMARRAGGSGYDGSAEDSVKALEQVLGKAVRRQMISDVPLGAFLSGGIDSSTVVALMQAQSDRPVRTFSIGFAQPGYNEAEHAAAVARHLGTDHTELYVSARDALDVVPNLPSLYSEPFSDSSQIPTFLVSQMARQHVTVALSGDSGDELFGGYNRYTMASRWWSRVSRIPQPLRKLMSAGVRSVSIEGWDRLGRRLPDELVPSQLGIKLHKAAAQLNKTSIEEVYLGLISHQEHPSALVQGSREPGVFAMDQTAQFEGFNAIERMMLLDTLGYMSDDILVKVDRAAMGVSLETRVPFLDPDVFEFAWSLPMDQKIRAGQGKWIVRQLLQRHVPKELIDRPKMGFSIPIGDWLRGGLRPWAEALLSENRLKSEGYFDPRPVRRMWENFLNGQGNHQYALWDILMFQAWLDHQ